MHAEPQTTEVLRRTQADVKGKIVEHAFWMQKEGYAESTITRRIRFLKTIINKGANLQDPESVKETLARQLTWQTKTKEIAVETYTLFLKMQGQTWSPPRYKSVNKLPFIPTEEELNNLIAGSNRKTATFLQLLKETGMRCGEAFMLKWTDFNFENRSVDVTPEKGSEPRQLKTSTQLIAMLNSLPRDKDQPFGCSQIHFARAFRKQRKRISSKLGNPRILKNPLPHLTPLESHNRIRQNQRYPPRNENSRPQKHPKHIALHSANNLPKRRIPLSNGKEYRGRSKTNRSRI